MVGLLVLLPIFKQTFRPFCRCQPPAQEIRGATSRCLGLSWSRSLLEQEATIQKQFIESPTIPCQPARPSALFQTHRPKKKGTPQVQVSISDYPPGLEEGSSRRLPGPVWSVEHPEFWTLTSPHLSLELKGLPVGRRSSHRQKTSSRPKGCLGRLRRMSSMPSTVSWEKLPMELSRQLSNLLRQPLASAYIKRKNICR